jgi:hypothetical protein
MCRPWQKVDVDDDFFTSLSEPGFHELEVLGPSTAGAIYADSQALIAKADAELAQRGCGRIRSVAPTLRKCFHRWAVMADSECVPSRCSNAVSGPPCPA